MSDVPLPGLAPFRLEIDEGRLDAFPTRSPWQSETSAPRVVSGWIAGDTRTVCCVGEAGRYAVGVAGIGAFSVDTDGSCIACNRWDCGGPTERFEEVLLGPPLALLLAGYDSWCLHASAVLYRGRALLFLGPSGRGKSTLAAHFAEREGLERLADDILPCTFVDAVPSANPYFPQLKLPAAAQYRLQAPESVPIGALIFLGPVPKDGPVVMDTLEPRAAIKELVEQTVAVGLFDRWLHVRHLRFMAHLIASVPAFSLRYPHDYARLAEVSDAIIERIDHG